MKNSVEINIFKKPEISNILFQIAKLESFLNNDISGPQANLKIFLISLLTNYYLLAGLHHMMETRLILSCCLCFSFNQFVFRARHIK